jgi:hypothetical protein
VISLDGEQQSEITTRVLRRGNVRLRAAGKSGAGRGCAAQLPQLPCYAVGVRRRLGEERHVQKHVSQPRQTTSVLSTVFRRRAAFTGRLAGLSELVAS